jgi:hypothetical protein
MPSILVECKHGLWDEPPCFQYKKENQSVFTCAVHCAVQLHVVTISNVAALQGCSLVGRGLIAKQMQMSWVVFLPILVSLTNAALASQSPQEFADLENWVVASGGKVPDLGPSLTEAIQAATRYQKFQITACCTCRLKPTSRQMQKVSMHA